MPQKEQTAMITEFDFRNVPAGYQLCFNSECPKKDECLRYLAGQHLSDNNDWGPAIYPNIKIGEKGCRFYRTEQPKRMAWGFDKLFEEVKRKHSSILHNALHVYLNSKSNYYRYHHGELLLSPKQQEWIIKLFKKYGYTENLEFDHYVYAYDFFHT